MMKSATIVHIAEPLVQFRFGQKLEYPRDGLYLFGPVDASTAPRTVRYGAIGTPESLRRFRQWAATVSSFIDVPPPRPGAKTFEPHHVPFPGFSEAFYAVWSAEPARCISDVSEQSLLQKIRIANRHEAIKAVVDVFVERLVATQQRGCLSSSNILGLLQAGGEQIHQSTRHSWR